MSSKANPSHGRRPRYDGVPGPARRVVPVRPRISGFLPYFCVVREDTVGATECKVFILSALRIGVTRFELATSASRIPGSTTLNHSLIGRYIDFLGLGRFSSTRPNEPEMAVSPETSGFTVNRTCHIRAGIRSLV